jgi:hypothetical protein
MSGLWSGDRVKPQQYLIQAIRNTNIDSLLPTLRERNPGFSQVGFGSWGFVSPVNYPDLYPLAWIDFLEEIDLAGCEKPFRYSCRPHQFGLRR